MIQLTVRSDPRPKESLLGAKEQTRLFFRMLQCEAKFSARMQGEISREGEGYTFIHQGKGYLLLSMHKHWTGQQDQRD